MQTTIIFGCTGRKHFRSIGVPSCHLYTSKKSTFPRGSEAPGPIRTTHFESLVLRVGGAASIEWETSICHEPT